MEIIPDPSQKKQLSFNGKGMELLGIMLLNWLLTAVTLGLYYPWARVNRLKFFWENTELLESPFVFHGTGRELFKGFIKVFLYFVLFYAAIIYASVTRQPLIHTAVVMVFSLSFILIVPLAIHGAMRYRLSRTSWRGIHMGYRGDRGQLISQFIMGYILTMITFGIYTSWFVTNLRTYIIGNIRFGSVYFGYTGKGFDLFLINLKGLILSVLTLGIYYFWYKKEWMNYYVQNTYVEQFGTRYRLTASFKGMEYLGLIVLNMLAIIITFGLAIPWVAVRNIEFIMNRIEIPAEIDFNNIAQTEDDYRDATGDDMIDVLDLGIV